MTEKESEIIELLIVNPNMSIPEIAQNIGLGKTSTDKRIASLKKRGVLRREGSKKNGRWIVIGK